MLKNSLPLIGVCLTALCLSPRASGDEASIHGVLRIHPKNPRYFTDDTGRAVLLTGSHTWNNLVDMGPTDPPASFDYDAYLDWMAAYPHNFFRLWAWELVSWNTQGNREKTARVHHVAPHPWQRTGPGKALDGKPKFDLTALDDAYFARLRQRVQAAQEHGIYVAVMLFEGWGVQFSPDAWKNHPFHPENNVNHIDGDLDHDGRGLEVHSGRNDDITGIQRAYVRRVIHTVNDFDNVLYEISNENHTGSTSWQYDMIRWIKKNERNLPKQHPVGMTFQYKGGSNQTLFDSPADWISPNNEGGYRDNPPAADGSKVILTDTDHLWGIGGQADWVWKSFLRGMNPIFMDPYDGAVLKKGFDPKWGDPLRQSMGWALEWSRRVDLAAMTPHNNLASSKYCLANTSHEYLVYLPQDKRVTVNLPAGRYKPVWFDTASGKEVAQDAFRHSAGQRPLTAPFAGGALLHLKRTP